MKKKINFGAVAFLIAFVLVVAFLVSFGIFYSSESKKVNLDLRNELMNKYKVEVYKTESNVHFIEKDKASVDLEVEIKTDTGFTSANVTVSAEKKDGKWTITFAPYDLSQIGKITYDVPDYAGEVLF